MRENSKKEKREGEEKGYRFIIWFVEKYIKNFSSEVFYQYLIFENNVRFFEERNFIKIIEYILYFFIRKFIGDLYFKKKLKLYSRFSVLRLLFWIGFGKFFLFVLRYKGINIFIYLFKIMGVKVLRIMVNINRLIFLQLIYDRLFLMGYIRGSEVVIFFYFNFMRCNYRSQDKVICYLSDVIVQGCLN